MLGGVGVGPFGQRQLGELQLELAAQPSFQLVTDARDVVGGLRPSPGMRLEEGHRRLPRRADPLVGRDRVVEDLTQDVVGHAGA